MKENHVSVRRKEVKSNYMEMMMNKENVVSRPMVDVRE